MAKKKKIIVEGTEITLINQEKGDYISLTDIAKNTSDEPRFTIRNWMSNQNTISYLGAWEEIHNPDFNRAGFRTVKDEFFDNAKAITPKRWIELTNSIGMYSKGGRYGGTLAHSEIAINFCYWLSPVFQVYLIKEFQRLKEEETKELDWSVKRSLAKINYTVHTDAIKQNLLPPKFTKGSGIAYANEADVLNVAVFGMTAKEWRMSKPELQGNLRDHATHLQLIIIANLEAVNAELIRLGLAQDERTRILNEAAINQMESLLSSPSLSKLTGDDLKSKRK